MPIGKKKGKRNGKKPLLKGKDNGGVLMRNQNQAYAKIEKILGGGRYNLTCLNTDKGENIARLGILRGKIGKNIRKNIRRDDYVLISIREYQDDKCDIEYVYNFREVKELQRLKEIPYADLNMEEDEDYDDEFEDAEQNKDDYENTGEKGWNPYEGIDDSIDSDEEKEENIKGKEEKKEDEEEESEEEEEDEDEDEKLRENFMFFDV